MDAGHRNYASFKSVTFYFKYISIFKDHFCHFSLPLSCELLLNVFLHLRVFFFFNWKFSYT